MSTTIKVSTSTRDRVNALGSRTRQTAEQVVARALEEYERSLFWAEYAAAADAASSDPDAAEVEERAAWDRTTPDGIDVG